MSLFSRIRLPEDPALRAMVRFLIALGAALGIAFIAIWVGRMGGMPAPAGIALAILMIAAVYWVSEAVPLYVTSFVVLFLCIVWLGPSLEQAGSEVKSDVFLAPFFSNIILLFLGGFVLSAALHKYRLDEQMARLIIRQCGTSLPRLMLGIMGVTAFLSMWLSNTATAAMMLALVLPIVRGLPEISKARKALVLCIPFAANAGGLGTPIGSPPNAIALQYMNQLAIAPSFGMWMLVGVPGAVGMVLVAWMVLRVLFRSADRLEGIDCAPLQLPVSHGVVVVLAGTVITVIGWLTGAWHGMRSGTVALIPLILFFGTGILNVRDLRSMSWDVLLVMGGGLCLGTAIAASGLATWVVARLPGDSMPAYGLMVAFGVLACVMSTVMSNTATANLIMPILLGLSVEPLSPVLLGVAFACSLAMALPISTPPNAMAFSSGEVKASDLLRPGLMITVIGIALAFTVGYWWWDLSGFF